MFKNKIYNYITSEFIKSFILILSSLSLIAWTVRAVNFLDLIVDSGYSTSTYFLYSLLNITNIITKFIPLSFLLALLFTIIKLERQNELLVLWTSGISKIKISNLFLKLSFFVLFIYILFSTLITPTALNHSRNLIKVSGVNTLSNLLKPNVFSDTFKGLTFYVGKKNNNMIENIFIKDEGNNLSNLLPEKSISRNQTIIAEKGTIEESKIILKDGIIQSLDKDNNLKIIQFDRTLLNFSNYDNRVIRDAKIQETSTLKILTCVINFYQNKFDNNQVVKNCPKKDISIVIETLSRRFIMPIYIPVVSLLLSFLLVHKKNKKSNIFSRYIFFIFSFILLVFAELLVRYSGLSNINFYTYLITPLIVSPLLFFILSKKFKKELK